MLDKARNVIARLAAQIRTGHWRSAVYLHRIRKRADDKCWFCQDSVKITQSHVLLHCRNPKLVAARLEAWEGKNLDGVRVLLANPRWERRFVCFLELSEVRRMMVSVKNNHFHCFQKEENIWKLWKEKTPLQTAEIYNYKTFGR